MAEIGELFGSGGSGSTPKGSGSPTVAGALRDVADDLSDLQVATIAAADAVAAAGDPPTKVEFDAVVTLLNEVKGALNTVAGQTIRTTKG